MMRKSMLAAAAAMFVLGLAGEARAQVVQSANLGVGWFMVKGEDSRATGDVLLEDLQSLQFEVGDFNGALLNGEWLVTFSDRFEAGVGVGFYQRTVPSIYRSFVDSDGSEIEQDLKLRVFPVTATVRLLPIGRAGDFQPYFGAGVALLNWRYTETGEFVDFRDNSIFRDRYEASGSTVAPVVLGGVRIPLQGDVFALNGEVRWQGGEGEIDTDATGLLGDKIDLGGTTALVSIQLRF